ncbi:hypothetical protein EYC59_02340 [Candidatus Saccharibacteria bacterium]|nr:MAG: hypothetical protein EYC59_02340 [Candidatus Saccharibacteria bacterium]
MAGGRNEGGSQGPARFGIGAGFSQQRRAGFAEYGTGSAGFAAHAPTQAGFAAALRRAQAAEAGEQQPKKPTKPAGRVAGRIDKEETRRHRDSAPVPALPSWVVGRKINLSQRGNNDWPVYLDKLARHNGKGVVVERVTNLVMRYVSDEEVRSMLAERFDGGKALRNRREREALRNLQRSMNDYSRAEHDKDVIEERKLLAESAGLADRARARREDPDNPVWYSDDYYEDNRLDRFRRENMSLWLPGDFETKAVGRSTSDTMTILVDDRSLVLRQARNRFLDKMDSIGLNTTLAEEEWTPQVEVLHTLGRRSLDGMQLNVPDYPLYIPLQAPRVYEA